MDRGRGVNLCDGYSEWTGSLQARGEKHVFESVERLGFQIVDRMKKLEILMYERSVALVGTNVWIARILNKVRLLWEFLFIYQCCQFSGEDNHTNKTFNYQRFSNTCRLQLKNPHFRTNPMKYERQERMRKKGANDLNSTAIERVTITTTTSID